MNFIAVSKSLVGSFTLLVFLLSSLLAVSEPESQQLNNAQREELKGLVIHTLDEMERRLREFGLDYRALQLDHQERIAARTKLDEDLQRRLNELRKSKDPDNKRARDLVAILRGEEKGLLDAVEMFEQFENKIKLIEAQSRFDMQKITRLAVLLGWDSQEFEQSVLQDMIRGFQEERQKLNAFKLQGKELLIKSRELRFQIQKEMGIE